MTSRNLVEYRYEESRVFKPHQHCQVQENAQQKNLFPLPFLRNTSYPDPQVKIGHNCQKKQNDKSSSAFIIEEETYEKEENIAPPDFWMKEWETEQNDPEKNPEIDPCEKQERIAVITKEIFQEFHPLYSDMFDWSIYDE